jgi:hypothetical protein
MTKWIWAATLALAVTGASAKDDKTVKKSPKAASAAGQVFCGPQGCRPVQAGCHIESKVYMGMSGTNNVEICN